MSLDTTVSYLYSTMWIDSLIFYNDKFVTFGKVHGTAYYIVIDVNIKFNHEKQDICNTNTF